jgi:hypothetical protein
VYSVVKSAAVLGAPAFAKVYPPERKRRRATAGKLGVLAVPNTPFLFPKMARLPV